MKVFQLIRPVRTGMSRTEQDQIKASVYPPRTHGDVPGVQMPDIQRILSTPVRTGMYLDIRTANELANDLPRRHGDTLATLVGN